MSFRRASATAYDAPCEPQKAPELPAGATNNVAQIAVRSLLRSWGLDKARFGSPDWNPISDLVAKHARVLLKPNWVLHYNQSGSSLDCLITHPSVIEAVAQYVALNQPSQITIGDAPIQGCDFSKSGGVLRVESDCREHSPAVWSCLRNRRFPAHDSRGCWRWAAIVRKIDDPNRTTSCLT